MTCKINSNKEQHEGFFLINFNVKTSLDKNTMLQELKILHDAQ